MDGIYRKLALFEPNLDTHHSPKSFCQFSKFIWHIPKWDNQNRSRDDPHTKGLENVSICMDIW